ncbi:MAG: hypothetical protein JXM69_13335 [Anaerolineae bacterium]|nr:hypothetical protein [Anaerolineae bacterium]
MLRNVLVDYLDTVKEREFDLPFLTLLPAMGFYDVHYTHGQVEFSKDFIAKKVESGVEIQYSFQSKAGDVSQSDWRDGIMGQMLESVLTGLSHPDFDRNLSHQVVLITTGRLKGNAALGLQDLNTRIEQQYKLHPICLWDRERLADYLESYGLGGMHRATASGFSSLGNFYMLYGKSLQNDLSEREIERHSRYWVNESLDKNKRLLGAAIESEIIASQCIEHGLFYEAMHAYLAVLRVILDEMHRAAKTSVETSQMLTLYERALEKVRLVCGVYHSDVKQLWQEANQNLVRVIEGPGAMITYLIHCARILEVSGFLYFLEDDAKSRSQIASFIEDFVLREPGCAHIPSDRYAVSLVLPVIVLDVTSRSENTLDFLKNVTVWLCDRYEEGWGLAFLEADPSDEIVTLFGHPFEFMSKRERSGSLLASVISDLAAFLGDKQFYSDVVNDIKASKISPEYWQAFDTEGLFRIEGGDVIGYPHIEYKDNLTDFSSYDFAEHVAHEPRSFQIQQLVGPLGFMSIMLLLRDRYFPTMWPLFVGNDDRGTTG